MTAGDVRLTIDGREVRVPPGTLIVDAAKRVGVDIPVFCYHPKLEPVGMCRMCLVEIGRPVRDRATGEVQVDDHGTPVLQYGPKLETACTTPVGEGWDVRVSSEKARQGRNEVVEFLLTSHPLDCPICDKGGECPLQNLTLEHGPGKSRFLFDDKIRLDKRVPLGDLIVLDRERCIQCARCVRFQEEIAGDPVLGFFERGRKLEIVTFSDPGFDSYFSGNTTDICPVGALTTADFRFGARPWELNAAASICPHCPVGCNLTLNTRREAVSGGLEVVKRVMPRQNEAVNETWICDKGRFAYHFAASPERLKTPLVRKDGRLVEATWDEALETAAEGMRTAGSRLVGIASGRLSNEDLMALRTAVETVGGRPVLDAPMGGGDFVRRFGLGSQSDLGRLGRGDAVLVIASDLHEEAPIWWLRLRKAAERGAEVIVANARRTRLDEFASHVIRYEYGQAVEALLGIGAAATGETNVRGLVGEAVEAAGKALRSAAELVIFFGAEGLDAKGTAALAQGAAAILARTGHAAKEQSGLVGIWPQANLQGAWDLGWRPTGRGLADVLGEAKAALIAGVDPLGDDPSLGPALGALDFLIVQELFLTETAATADVVLPAQAFIEREGRLTSGEGRVQRYYPAVPTWGEARPDWSISSSLAAGLGAKDLPTSAAAWLERIAEVVPAYHDLSYQALARVEEQWPLVGGDDLYFGGTAYENRQGLGVALASEVERGGSKDVDWPMSPPPQPGPGILAVPVHRLYDRGTTLLPSRVLDPRRVSLYIALNPSDATAIGVGDGEAVSLAWDGQSQTALAVIDPSVPQGAALIPRSAGATLSMPTRVTLLASQPEAAR